jgi:hypothetical protein
MLHAFRRALTGVSFAILGSAVTILLMGKVSAQPEPVPGPSQPVREQNLDANRFIRVHEQGTANVNVANSQLTVGGTVSVDNFPSSFSVNNFPSQFDVNVTGGTVEASAPVASTSFAGSITVQAKETGSLSFATINATHLSISPVTPSPEVVVQIQSPLSGLTFLSVPNTLFYLNDPDGDRLGPSYMQSFTRPVPINGVTVFCANESNLCQLLVSVVGS